MAKKKDGFVIGSDKPAEIGAIINTVAAIIITPIFGIVAGQSPDGIPTYLGIIVAIINAGILFEAVMGWIIFIRWMKTSATWPYMWLKVMGFIPFGFITYLIAAKEWQKDYSFCYQGGREDLLARQKAFEEKQAAEEEERKRKEAAFRATPEGKKLTEKEDQIKYFTDAAKYFCGDGSWDYGKEVPSPAFFDLRCRLVDLNEKEGTVYIHFESDICMYAISHESLSYQTRVELDCKNFCKGRATKLASRVREEILPRYQNGSVGYYFSKFQRVKSIIEFHVKK